MASSNIKSGLYKSLAEAGRHFYVKLLDTMSNKNLPKVIGDATSVDSPVVKEDSGYIDIKIDLKSAPMAAAFEWGSGAHDRRGIKQIIIKPTGGKAALAIPRSRWPDYVPPPDVDPVRLKLVHHPGIVARPYIEPTIKAEKEQIKKILSREFKASILLDLKEIVTIND